VALLDRSDHAHNACEAAFREFSGEFISTEAVLTEATHLLSDSPRAVQAALAFFVRGGALLVPCSREGIERSATLMEKYRDIPMDYADATLVCLAEETGIREIFTLDRRGFASYRSGRAHFDIFP
jgi:hypothetical protein